MSEFEEKLGAILSDQSAMEQIMSLAKSLGGGSTDAAAAPPAEDQPADPPAQGSGDLLSVLGGIDPRLISMAMRLAGEYSSNDDQRAALLEALRPFVRPERYAKLDKAIQISKLTRVIRIALDTFRHKGDEADHV